MATSELPVLGNAGAQADGASCDLPGGADGAGSGAATGRKRDGTDGPTTGDRPAAADAGARLGRGPIGAAIGPEAHALASGAEVLAQAAREAGVSAEPTIPDDAIEEVRALWAALCEVRDPELPVSLVDLGLIYDIRRDGGRVEVEMTFTAMGCPCMMVMEMDVQDRLLEEDDVDAVEIDVVWDPPWRRERMTEKARKILRNYGVAA